MVKRKTKKHSRAGRSQSRSRHFKKQKGGFGGALAMGMLVPQLLGTVGNILKINV